MRQIAFPFAPATAVAMSLAITPLAATQTQSIPPQLCTPGAVDPGTSLFELRHGGETRQIESRVTASGTQIWTAEGGGRIRTSPGNNQNWVFQETPEDVQQTLLDIWFEPGSSTRGWAAGRAGHLLRTVDGGNTWEHFDANQPEIPDSTGIPANISTIWKTRWVDTDGEGDPDLGFIAGMYTFKRNDVGSAHNASDFKNVKLWTDLSAVDTNAMVGDLEPHCLLYTSPSPRDQRGSRMPSSA